MRRMPAEIVKLACQGCGANLEVAEGIRFVTCNFCASKLEVVRDESVTHTRLLKDIADNLKVIEVQNDLEQLDREWEGQREGFKVFRRNGTRALPNARGSVVGGVVGIGFGILWIAVASQAGAPGFFPLIGLVFVALAASSMVSSTRRASAFSAARSDYEARRAELVTKLESLRRGD